jgi:hypothetical protein
MKTTKSKTNKLGLKKETLKDLNSLKGKAAAIKGGALALSGAAYRCGPGDTCAR